MQALRTILPNVGKSFGYLPVFKPSCYVMLQPQKTVGGISWRKLDVNKDGKVKGENMFFVPFSRVIIRLIHPVLFFSVKHPNA